MANSFALLGRNMYRPTQHILPDDNENFSFKAGVGYTLTVSMIEVRFH